MTCRRCIDEQSRGKEALMTTTDQTLGLPSSRWRLIEYSLLVACLLISASLILGESGVVPSAPMDQHFVETVNLELRLNNGQWVFQYPNLQYAGGITSSLVAGLYKLIIPTTHDNLNWHFRIFSMAGLLISSFCLFQTTIPKNPGLRTAAFLIIATSGYQLLQPSSDVLAGTFLCLFLIAALRAWPKLIAALFLALFGLGKVELTLGAIVLSLFWTYWQRQQGDRLAWRSIAYTVLWISAFLFPGLVLQGANPFAASRSTVAFMSAYSGFMRFHQFQAITPTTGEAIQATQDIVFRDAKSFTEVVVKYPDLYFDFLGVSAARSIPNLLKVFKFMLIPLGLICLRWRHIHANRWLMITALLAALCILLPSWLVIYVRMRYIAKVLPAITAATIAGVLELSDRDMRSKMRIRRLTWISAVATILWQTLSLSAYQD